MVYYTNHFRCPANSTHTIENGRIKPSPKLVEHVSGLLKGNKEFILIDEQKLANSIIICDASKQDKRRTVIVKGGPGTGKSVVSINVFGELLRKELNVRFIAPNESFRKVIIEMLANKSKRERNKIEKLFSGSYTYYCSNDEEFDVLVCDEAHRLKDKSDFFYKGENQIEDIIRASRTNVFFIDDSQSIKLADIGSVEEINKIAHKYGSEVTEIELTAQFRCSGAEGYINWLDTILQIRDTGNLFGWDRKAFDFKIFDNPNTLFKMISDKNAEGYKARMLAGFAWNWAKDENDNGQVEDVDIPECNFKMPWNGRAIRATWAIEEQGINQIGCVHTSQGLEFDYVGVIIGYDMKFNKKTNTVYASYNDYKDNAGKKGLKEKPKELTRYVKNIYKILLTRGMKGCYVFCRDIELKNHFIERLNTSITEE